MSVQESRKTWTVKELMDWTTRYLSEKQFESARVNVEWLLCDTLGCPRMDLYVNFDRPLAQSELDQFRARLTRRLSREPLQYIVGSADFMGLRLAVGPDVLIPRSDTELLVEKALGLADTIPEDRKVSILDIGTGSGAIAIALDHFLSGKQRDHEITAIDISKAALDLARRNSERLNGAVQFVQADTFDDGWVRDAADRFDLIVSNPPYISEKEYLLLDEEVRQFEPKEALWAPDNGLAFYERIGHICKILFRSSATCKLALEMAFDQNDAVTSILAAKGITELRSHLDTQDHYRVITGSHYAS